MPNPFPDQENLLTKERLHWGIIAPAIILGILLVGLSLPLVLIIKSVANLRAQFNPKEAGFDLKFAVLGNFYPNLCFLR